MKAVIKKDARKGMTTILQRVESIREFGGKAIGVGLPKEEQATYPDGTPVETVAMAHEFGTDKLPERPFLRPGLKEALPVAADMIKESQGQDADQTLSQVGLYAASKVQKGIENLSDPPNNDETVKRKGSSNPLIDTGRLRQAITHIVRER